MSRDKIMIVDDEVDITALFEEVLTTLGHKVESFNNPLAALDVFGKRHSDFALILSDIRMPKMSGIEMIEKISKIDSQAKIILMGAFDITDNDMKEINIKEFLRKPIQITQLSQLVEDCMQAYKTF